MGMQCPVQVPGECFLSDLCKGVLAGLNSWFSEDNSPDLWWSLVCGVNTPAVANFKLPP